MDLKEMDLVFFSSSQAPFLSLSPSSFATGSVYLKKKKSRSPYLSLASGRPGVKRTFSFLVLFSISVEAEDGGRDQAFSVPAHLFLKGNV